MNGDKPKTLVADGTIAIAPRAPEWLSREAQAEWCRVVPVLVTRRILTEADLGSLESYCTAMAAVREASKILNAEGIIKGGKRHPAFSIMNVAQSQARLLAAELGLTPVSRSRKAIREDADAGKDADNPLAM